MSTHGCILLVEDHETRRQSNDGSYVHFKYPQPISRHNWSKNWVDDANNCIHDTISLSDTWRKKYWPNRQFTFFLSVAETNEVSAQAQAQRQPADAQLDFRRNHAQLMLQNCWDSSGNEIAVAEGPVTRSKTPIFAFQNL